jgi:predicted ribosomally synthesized peptide with SipW-like signal peptide
MRFKTIAMTGVLSLAGLGLIGAGAHAVFSQNTSSAQTITAGTLNVVVSAPGATEASNSADVCTSAANDCTAITLPPTNAYESSSFLETYTVTITNTSNIPVNEIAYTLTDPNALANAASLAFDQEAWVCLYSDGYIYANEPMGVVEAYGQTAEIDTLAPLSTDSYSLVVYAGPIESTGCGGAVTRYHATPWTSPGGTVVPAQYAASSNGNSPTTPDYTFVNSASVPLLGVNTGAASLVSAAEGGVITPTFTVTYEG